MWYLNENGPCSNFIEIKAIFPSLQILFQAQLYTDEQINLKVKIIPFLFIRTLDKNNILIKLHTTKNFLDFLL